MGLSEYDRARLRYLCDESLYFFIITIYGFIWYPGVENPPPILNEAIHKPLCNISQDRSIKRKIFELPRDWRKSLSFTKMKALWKYLKNNESRILIVSENQKLANMMLSHIEAIITGNELLRFIYPELAVVDRLWKRRNPWNSMECLLPRKGIYNEPTFQAIGVGGAAQSRHVTDIYLDDIIGKAARDSKTVMVDTMVWFDNVKELLDDPHLDSPHGGEIQLSMTRWAVGDVHDYVAKNYPEYRIYVVPALKCPEDMIVRETKDNKQVSFLQRADVGNMESNWPEAFTTEYYLSLMTNPEQESTFYAQHLNMPVLASGVNTFKYDWLKFYHWKDDEQGRRWVVCEDDSKEEILLSNIQPRGVIDPGGFAEKITKKSSRCALVIAGQAKRSRKKFILDTWAKNALAPSELMKIVFAMQEKWKPLSWTVETIAGQAYIFKDIREEMNKAGKYVTMNTTPKDAGAMSEDAKNKRITGLKNPCFNGEYYVHASMKELIAEYKSDPTGFSNDMLDAWAWYNQIYGTGIPRENTSDLVKKKIKAWDAAREGSAPY